MNDELNKKQDNRIEQSIEYLPGMQEIAEQVCSMVAYGNDI